MKVTQEQVLPNQAVDDEQVLETDELKTLAKLLDVLMEADFETNRKKGLTTNAC